MPTDSWVMAYKYLGTGKRQIAKTAQLPATISHHNIAPAIMPNNITLYHNPRCSKSRAALELLKSREIDANVIEYLKTPPDRQTLQSILALLEITPAQLLRRSETLYKTLKLGDTNDEDTHINAMLEHPILIERPILTTKDAAAIGRPLDQIVELLDEL